jgi:hypothetical protein
MSVDRAAVIFASPIGEPDQPQASLWMRVCASYS